MGRVHSSRFAFYVIRQMWSRKITGFSVRLWPIYFEIGLVRKLESAPLTDEERAMLEEDECP